MRRGNLRDCSPCTEGAGGGAAPVANDGRQPSTEENAWVRVRFGDPAQRLAEAEAIRHDTTMMTFFLARADNGVIGRDGQLPWHLPADLRRFKAMTMGKPLVMGRKTFESFPRPLPGRRHIVLTRDSAWSAQGAEVVHSVVAALESAGGADADVAVIGGAEIFTLLLPRADRIELTEVHAAPEGDAVVPPFDGWREIARADFPAEGTRPAYAFVTLERAPSGVRSAASL